MKVPIGMRKARGTSHVAGFTLIEVLAVILILSILMTFIVVSVGGSQRTMQIENTRAWLIQVSGMVEEYERELGKYPPSTFPADMEHKPSRLNMGAEMLVITLWSQDSDWQAPDVPEERLGNTDGDRTKTSLTTFSSADAFAVKARVSSKTGDPYRRRSFQLISAGPDGVFQTEDDIANFKIERD